MREAELAELKKDTEKLIEDTTSFNPIEKAGEEIKKAVESSPMPAISAAAPVAPSENEVTRNETNPSGEKPDQERKA
jgi:hypothetical protein